MAAIKDGNYFYFGFEHNLKNNFYSHCKVHVLKDYAKEISTDKIFFIDVLIDIIIPIIEISKIGITKKNYKKYNIEISKIKWQT
jgi:hypothetical protein